MNTLQRVVLSALLALMPCLAGCGGADGGAVGGGAAGVGPTILPSETVPTDIPVTTVTLAPPEPIPLAGAASKGPLLDCTIRIFAIQRDGSRGVQVAGAPITAAIVTQPPTGSWSVTIPGDLPGPFITEATGENCRYVDEATGQLQSTANTPILGLLPAGASTAAITPLTHALALVVQNTLAAAAAAGTPTSPAVVVSNVVANATQTFGLDLVRTLPPDPRNLQANTAAASQLQYAQILGGLSLILNRASGNIATQLTSLAQDLTDGELDGRTALQGTPTTATNLIQDARAGGLQAGNLQQAVQAFASSPPTGVGLDNAGFATAASTAPVRVSPPPRGGLAAPLAATPKPTAANITTLQNTEGTTTVSPGDSNALLSHTFLITTLPANLRPSPEVTATVTRAVDDTGLVVYRPPTGFVGTDSLEVAVTNSATPPLTGAVTIGITVVAAPPTTLTPTADPNPLVIGAGDDQGVVTVSHNDPIPGGHTFVVTTPPAHGAANPEGSSGRIVYRPTGNFVGSDSMVVTVTRTNPTVPPASGTVTINITVLSGTAGVTPG